MSVKCHIRWPVTDKLLLVRTSLAPAGLLPLWVWWPCSTAVQRHICMLVGLPVPWLFAGQGEE